MILPTPTPFAYLEVTWLSTISLIGDVATPFNSYKLYWWTGQKCILSLFIIIIIFFLGGGVNDIKMLHMRGEISLTICIEVQGIIFY